MATIIGTEESDDTTLLRSIFTDHGKALFGTEDDDRIYGLGGDDLIFGDGGDDYIDGGEGADVAQGGDGNDTYIVDNTGDGPTEFAGGGIDKVVTFVDFTLSGFIENLTLAATAGAIDGTGNNLDNDIIGNDFANVLDGKDGDDDIEGRDGEDTLFGGAGDDHLSGGRQDDILSGGLDNDTLDGGQGADQMFGGGGDDTYYVDNSGDVVSEFLGSGIDAVFSVVSFTLPSGVEALVLEDPAGIASGLDGTGNNLDNTISGGERNNTLRGLDGDDILVGGGGNDTLFGGNDSDTLYGNEDNDTLNGGTGADEMIGGTGNDTYSVDNVGDTIEEHLNEGTDTVNVSNLVNFTLGANLENLVLLTGTNGTGNALANTITGNLLDNRLDGAGGADTMAGQLGNDTYIVDNANDRVVEAAGQGALDRVQTGVSYVLTGGAEVEVLETRNPAATAQIDLVGNEFNNTIIGNNGNNTIAGSVANDGGAFDGLDVMTGGGGGDVFVWTSTAETGVAGNEADVVTDFNRAQGDLLAFNLIDADETAAGNQAFTFIGTAPITGAGQISFFTTDTDTFILLSTDADTAQEMTIRVQGVHQVDASWFVL